MEAGSIVLKKPLWDWLLFGFGFGDLCFRKGEDRWSSILEIGQIRKGHRCRECFTLIIEGQEPLMR
jgi:hypothetical protein